MLAAISIITAAVFIVGASVALLVKPACDDGVIETAAERFGR
jgi:hypothetical protein